MWFWKLAALGFAGILDLAMGAFFVHVLSVHFAHPLEWWQYAIGAALGASPDIDILWCAFLGKDSTGHHEYLTHRPIVGIPFAAALGLLLGGELWAWCAGIGAFWHYLHDTEGFLGLPGGIAWCWPFSKKYWGVRNYQVVSETLEEFFGRNEIAFGNFFGGYLTPTRRSITEFALTSIFGGYVVGDLFGFYPGAAVALLFWAGIVKLWMLYRPFSTFG